LTDSNDTDYLQAKKKAMNYVDSDSEGTDGDVFKPIPALKKSRPNKRRKVSESAEKDTYEENENAGAEFDDGRGNSFPFLTFADLCRHG